MQAPLQAAFKVSRTNVLLKWLNGNQVCQLSVKFCKAGYFFAQVIQFDNFKIKLKIKRSEMFESWFQIIILLLYVNPKHEHSFLENQRQILRSY